MAFIPEHLMDEVQKRPGLWKPEMSIDRLERLTLWKEVGEALFKDWDTINKATAYDRVLQLQKKWRSYKDGYNREIRRRKANVGGQRKVYVYFDKLSFLGGQEGLPEPKDEFDIGDERVDNADADQDEDHQVDEAYQPETADPLVPKAKRKRKKQKRVTLRKRSLEDYEHSEQVDVSTFPIDVPGASMSVGDDDGDRLFLMSFVPEIKKLHPNIKMWVRSQIANVMQEAVTAHFNNTMPSSSNAYDGSKLSIKRQRESSSE